MFRRRLIGFLFAIGAIAGIAASLQRAQIPPTGPQPVAWDRESCAECRMMFSDRRFAAQLQTAGGQTFNFDDPGCLMIFLAHQRVSVRAMYFRDQSQDRWLATPNAGFIHSFDSPMRRGWAAVPRGTPGSVSYEEAAKQVEAGLKK